MNKLLRYALVCVFSLAYISTSLGANRIGRMGLGTTTQFKNGLPAISFKLQKSKSFALGLLASYSSSATGGYGIGVKAYRNLFEEPQLNFYMAGLAGYLNQKSATTTDLTGFQLDLTMGSEFSFSGLQSIGFSFEFGFSVYNLSDFVFETVGHNFLVAGVHFYL